MFALSALGVGFSAWHDSKANVVSDMVAHFEQGVGDVHAEAKKDKAVGVDRASLHKQLTPISHPASTETYLVIRGEQGMGKSPDPHACQTSIPHTGTTCMYR